MTHRLFSEEEAVPPRYEIRVTGQLDETAATAFDGLDVAACGTVTVITGEFDQAALHGLLEWIRSLGLELLEARRARGPAPRPRPG